MTKVFIDGSAGTTGLRIYDRLSTREDIQLIILDDENRKKPEKRAEALNAADIAFLCLPDAAAIESVGLVTSENTVIIDTSTAHRTAAEFTYGFPELVGKEAIASSKRIANPGCHASGFVSLIYPLVKAGLLDKDAKLSCTSLTGYSGGGKNMIADYEMPRRNMLLNAPRQYGLSQQHKHLKEMKHICGLENAPLFSPIVADFYSGMEVTVPLYMDMIKGSIENVKDAYKEFYTGPLVHYEDADDGDGFLAANYMQGRDDMQISVFGNEERIILVSRFDNLGKGASGSAIQNMNIVMGIDETTSLFGKEI